MGGDTGLVVMLFTDLVGSTETVARLGEARAEELRQVHFAALRDAIREHAGSEVKNLGDGLMVAFNSASDAVACAVSMQQAVQRQRRRLGETLAMRVGVAAGEATREDSDYFGTPVIEASRLCARAEGGQILVTEMARALAGTRGGQGFEPLGPMELKGLPEPVPAHQVRWDVLAESAPPLPLRLPVDRSLAFVGRAEEREVLEGLWKQVEQVALRVVLVEGEPGVGKTRLATEIALHAHGRGALVLFGSCDQGLAVPYQPFVEALHHVVTVCPEAELARAAAERGGELTRVLPQLAARMPGLPPPQDADPETERYLLFSAAADVLAKISRWRPVVLLLDDLHWATKPTLLLLKHLVRSAEPMAVLVVGTYRDSDIGRGHPLTELLAELRRERGVERISLRGLSGPTMSPRRPDTPPTPVGEPWLPWPTRRQSTIWKGRCAPPDTSPTTHRSVTSSSSWARPSAPPGIPLTATLCWRLGASHSYTPTRTGRRGPRWPTTAASSAGSARSTGNGSPP